MELITKAVIMAGGKGTRLKPFTDMTPKAILPVNGIPLLHLMIEKLHSFGITHFYLSVNYLSKTICDYFGDGSKFDIKITYIKEPYSMGTAGSISMIDIKEPFLVMNGDIYTDLDFRDFFVEFRKSESSLFICCREEELKSEYGVLKPNWGRVISWEEKLIYTHLINCGIYMFKPDIIKYIPKEHFFGMDDLAKKIMAVSSVDGDFVGHYLMNDKINWIDMGSVEDYENLAKLLTNKKIG